MRNVLREFLFKPRHVFVNIPHHAIFVAGALVVAAIGVYGLVDIMRQIGCRWSGVIWTRQAGSGNIIVDAYTPATWFGISYGLQGNDILLSVNGHPPELLAEVLKNTNEGETVVYLVYRDYESFEIEAPIFSLKWKNVVVPHGIMFLGGIIAILCGYWLVRIRTKQVTLLVSYVLLLSGATLLYAVFQKRGLCAPVFSPWLHALVFIPIYPLMSALLMNLAAIYPVPISYFVYKMRFPYVIYIIALVVLFVQMISFWYGGALDVWAFRVSMALVTFASTTVIVRGIGVYILKARGRIQCPASITIAIIIGIALMVGISAIPSFVHNMPQSVANLLLPLVVVYPIVMAYTARHDELVHRLYTRIESLYQMEGEVREIYTIQRKVLREISDTLHDAVLSEIRGLQLWLRTSQRRDRKSVILQSSDVEFLLETLHRVYEQLWALMEGAKPVDFQKQELGPAIKSVIERFCRRNPEIRVTLTLAFSEDHCPPEVKEAAYWIVQAALANCEEHAQASQVKVSVQEISTGDRRWLSVLVVDNGVGFDVAKALKGDFPDGRRHLGLRNMRVRARRLGGDVVIRSRPGNTEVRVLLPLVS